MTSFVAAAPFVLIAVLLSAADSIAQKPARASNPGREGPAIAIEKVNKRPTGKSSAQAISWYEGLLRKEPANAVVLNNLGALYFTAGRFYEAQSLIRRAAQNARDSAQIHINLAVAYNKSLNPGLAISTLEGVLQKDPSDARALAFLCDIYSEQDQDREAVECYERFMRSQKLDAVSATNFGTVLLDLGEIKRALEVMQEADGRFPNDPGLKNGIGIALYHRKKFTEAEKYLARAVELRPKEALIRYNLALLQVVTKKRGAALEQYRYLKTADPELAGALYKALFRDKLVFVDPK